MSAIPPIGDEKLLGVRRQVHTIGSMENTEEPQAVVLALVRDLLFGSRITASARAVGVHLRCLRDPVKLGEMDGRMLLVDLAEPGAVAAAAAWKRRYERPVVGFVAHVDTATIASAREAGIDRVLARGAFAAQLESILANG